MDFYARFSRTVVYPIAGIYFGKITDVVLYNKALISVSVTTVKSELTS